jgi:hypothetical protein
MGFVQRQHDAAMGAVRGQPVPKPAGPTGGAPMGGGRAGGPAVAAPAAGGLLGGADGAPLAPTGT